MNTLYSQRNNVLLLVLLVMFALLLNGCANNSSKKYQKAEIYLDCENYSTVENDPGNCRVIDGTTDGLRIKLGMVVTKDYVEDMMSNLGWKKESHTNKYIDYNGMSFRVEVYKYTRELEN